jgi:hypothetical protein
MTPTLEERRIPGEATLVLEQRLGVLVVAVAVGLLVIGLDRYGIINVVGGH